MTNPIPQPHNAEAEAAILGALFAHPGLFAEVADQLSAADLYMPIHVAVFEAMEALHRRKRPIEVLVVAEEMRAAGTLARLKDGDLALLEMQGDSPLRERVPALVKLVTDRAQQRRIIAACLEVAASAHGDRDPAEIIDELGSRLVKLSRASARDLSPIGAHLDAVVEAIERRQTAGREVTGVPTGILALDRLTSGFQSENDVVIAARPGEGKTAFALNVCRQLVRSGGAALFFSLEMNRNELLERLICQEGQLDSARLKIGNTADLWRDIIGAVDRIRPAQLYVVTDVFTLREMRTIARQFCARHPDQKRIGVTDYFQLMDHGARGRTTNEAMEESSAGFKRLAKELEMPWIVVSQLNRESEKQERPPRPSDLRGCGGLEQDADIILLPYNPQRIEEGEVDVLIPKNRNGRSGAVQAHWVGRNYTFGNAEHSSYLGD